MFVVSIIATFAFRPSQTEFFDKFNRLSHNRLQGSTEFSCSRNISTESIENNFHNISPKNDDSTKSVRDFEITNITSIEKSPRFHTVIGNGNESGFGSVSISSASSESENIDFQAIDIERLEATNFDENEVDENDLTEINLNSSRSEKSNQHKF
uniref:Uncharacterized protein n=1 Tax=Panagrolaimus davidi TaxID=227884 RepID=A0A914PFU1_9BILA